jgi:hypothetical protein
MINQSLLDYEYPLGPAWQKLFKERYYQNPADSKAAYVDPHPPALHFQRCRLMRNNLEKVCD